MVIPGGINLGGQCPDARGFFCHTGQLALVRRLPSLMPTCQNIKLRHCFLGRAGAQFARNEHALLLFTCGLPSWHVRNDRHAFAKLGLKPSTSMC